MCSESEIRANSINEIVLHHRCSLAKAMDIYYAVREHEGRHYTPWLRDREYRQYILPLQYNSPRVAATKKGDDDVPELIDDDKEPHDDGNARPTVPAAFGFACVD
jgi:hypothetical protein